MALTMRTSDAGLELIKSFEGFRSRATRLPNGKWVIGYGHTATAREGLRITRADAELLLRHHDLKPIEDLIAGRVLAPLSQNEFDALVSFAFNLGPKAFLGSNVLALLGSGERLQAAEAMSSWRKGKVGGEVRVIDALVRRRAAEKALFLEHPSGRVAIPGALVRPQFDPFAAQAVPQERPVLIETRSEAERPAARPQGGESAPQAAARAVSERITRILQEQEDVPLPPLTESEDGPTVDEITKAVSALAEPDAAPPPEADESLPPDLPQPPAPERLQAKEPDTGDLLELTDALPAAEETDWSALESPPGRVDETEDDLGLLRWLPYAFLSGLGMLGIFEGVRRILAPAASRLPAGNAAGFDGPILALGSAMLSVVAVYYLYRALSRQD
ncbi:MAG: lysozyme [Hyphomonas sp.]|nr:lysozyme [Hyphomonas sp.]